MTADDRPAGERRWLGYPPGTVRLVSTDVRRPGPWRRLWLRLTGRPVVTVVRRVYEAGDSLTTVYTAVRTGKGTDDE